MNWHLNKSFEFFILSFVKSSVLFIYFFALVRHSFSLSNTVFFHQNFKNLYLIKTITKTETIFPIKKWVTIYTFENKNGYPGMR